MLVNNRKQFRKSNTGSMSYHAAGFSLMELLIGMVIGALLLAMASLAFGDRRAAELETQANRLYALLKQAQDESMLRGIDMGIRIEPEFYRFYIFNQQDEQWLPIQDDEFFTERAIPETIELKLLVDGSTLFSEDEDDVEIFEDDVDIFEEEEEQIDPPQIYILSSGEMNDFKIALGWTDDEPRYFLISGTMLGDIEQEGPLLGNLEVEVGNSELLQLQ